ncbi:hypothetical protein NESM_000198700 [Novymonas esmeraldas]|uniref:Uncharacterized protein n=1 Tax=Novymonas esmeraldas TaxID=1808958 RepID=A0AAW0F8V3_9TRYP
MRSTAPLRHHRAWPVLGAVYPPTSAVSSHAAIAIASRVVAPPCTHFHRRRSAVWFDSSSAVHVHALRCSRAFVKSRSLSPDDPFGERGSWEDPSDGIYSAWQGVDQEGFVHAAESAEVRQAHFGPEWARFTTVGRMSVKKMREGEKVQHAPPSPAVGADGVVPPPPPSSRRYPSAEELHETDLRQRRRLLERNYASYEDFVEHELGGGEGFAEETEHAGVTTAAAEARVGRDDTRATGLHSAARMESAFAVVEGLDGRDRMAQRNGEREALETLEAAEVAEEVPLPPFMFEAGVADAAAASPALTRSGTTAATATSGAAPAPPPAMATELRRSGRSTGAPLTRSGAAADSLSGIDAPAGVPAAVVRQVLDALGAPHGDARVPLTDPVHWSTEDIILFLSLHEQRPPPRTEELDAAASWTTTMDATMCDAFRMSRATGDTLLNVVVPPRLFRLLRRWHVRRQDVVNTAWRLHCQAAATATAGVPAVKADVPLADDLIKDAVAQSGPRLAEAVQQLDRLLIQETILLCFPYGQS